MNRAAEDWRISDDLISELVLRSAGLPLHIDAVLKLALRLNARLPGREFTADDLSGGLPDVVQRLIRTLSPAEARAFRAACVLPSFDIQLAAAVAGVDAADVERAIRFALVEHDDGLVYPYRVHDEIRRLVKLDRDSEGYWSLADWESAARRGLHEAIARIKAGHELGSDAAQLQGIALAIRLGYEWDIYPEGLAKIVSDGPSIAVLAPLIPPESVVQSDSAISDFIRFVHALALPFDAGAARLLTLHPTDPEVAHFTLRWAMYRSRSVCRFDEAMRAAGLLVESAPPAFAKLSRYQYAVTLRACRRFADSEEYVKVWRPDRIDRWQAMADRLYGVANYDPTELARNSAGNTSRRFQLELEINDLVRNARFKGDLDVDRINAYLERSINLGQFSFQRDCLLLLGYANLGNRVIFDGLVDNLRNHESYDYSAYVYCQLLALRALYLGDREIARPAYQEIISRERSRNAYWISAEVWLEALGFDIPPEDTQWLMPYEDVRANWMMVADRLIRQAKARSGEAAELGS
ncbi:hypothetical protein ACFQNE_13855 [Gordonia phosphorivorans]|uniref:Uncharacterized protein n=1 Tax=Gordonia phosphorivorans TaxID=1056982 RepID=A0ABV6HCE0_9ACTN